MRFSFCYTLCSGKVTNRKTCDLSKMHIALLHIILQGHVILFIIMLYIEQYIENIYIF